MESHNPPPFGAQNPRWHSFPSPIDVGLPNPHPFLGSASLLAHRLVSTPFEAQPPRWHSFPSPIDVGPPNPPLSGPSILVGTPPCVHPPSGLNLLADTHSLLQSMWDSPIHPFQGIASLLAHHLMSTPLRGSTSSLAHRPMSGIDTICNGPNPPLTDVVLFGLSLSGFPSSILKRVCWREVSTPL